MRIAIVDHVPSLSRYLGELLRTWGVPYFDFVVASQLARLDARVNPVLVVPAGALDAAGERAVVAFANAGGGVIAMSPGATLLEAAGIECVGDDASPRRIRFASRMPRGLAGECLPVIGKTLLLRRQQGVKSEAIAYLTLPDVWSSETVGIAERAVGAGRIVVCAFDLPRCVMLLRQGDPAKVDYIPEGDGCARASHLAADIGPHDAGWTPFADLLALAFVDLTRNCLPSPAPILDHLPSEAPSVVLYSGDEDNADPAHNRSEFRFLASRGARMNLYIIPTWTRSTDADIAEYRQQHDLGPHPNLRELDRRPIADRVAEFDRQIQLFKDRWKQAPKSLRNHCLAWAGYTELIDVMERHGVRMDANYLAGGSYMRHRGMSPYASFGSAMPVRFVRTDGSVINVYQQPMQIEDDVHLNDAIEYSFKLSTAAFRAFMSRVLDDACTRFHTPVGVNIHPTNYATYSGDEGRAIVDLAQARGVPVWSYDQWCGFWEARDACRIEAVNWNGGVLSFEAHTPTPHADLRLLLPHMIGDKQIRSLTAGGERWRYSLRLRFHQTVALFHIPPSAARASFVAEYS